MHGIKGPWTILIVMQSNGTTGVQMIATWQPHKHKIRKELKDSTSTPERYCCRSSPYLPLYLSSHTARVVKLSLLYFSAVPPLMTVMDLTSPVVVCIGSGLRLLLSCQPGHLLKA